MSDGNIKLQVKRAALLNPEDVLQYDKMLEDKLAPYVQLPQAPPTPPAPMPDEELETPQSLAPVHEDPEYVPPRSAPQASRQDYSGELNAAQGKSRNLSLLANLGQANQALIEGVSGVKGGPMLQNLAKDANHPVEEVQERFDMDKTLSALKAKDAESDPNSPRNRMAQKAFASTFPGIAERMGASLGQQTEGSLAQWVKVGEKRDDIEYKDRSLKALTEYRGALDVNADAERARKSNNDQVKSIIDRYKAGSGRISAMKLNPGADKQPPIDDRFDITRLEKLGADTTKFAPFSAAFRALEEVAPGLIKGRVPAEYPLDAVERLKMKDPTGIAGNFVDPKAQRIYQGVNEVIDVLSRDRSGAVLNEPEIKQYVAKLQNGLAAGPQQTATALNEVRKSIGLKLRTKQTAALKKAPNSSASPFQMWQDNGGMSFLDPEWSDDDEGEAPGSAPSSAPPSEPNVELSTTPPMPIKSTVKAPSMISVIQKATGLKIPVTEEHIKAFLNNPKYEIKYGE